MNHPKCKNFKTRKNPCSHYFISFHLPNYENDSQHCSVVLKWWQLHSGSGLKNKVIETPAQPI